MSGYFHEDGGPRPWRSMSRLVLFIVAVGLVLGFLVTLWLLGWVIHLLATGHPTVAAALEPVSKVAVGATVALVGLSGSYLIKMAASTFKRQTPGGTAPPDPTKEE